MLDMQHTEILIDLQSDEELHARASEAIQALGWETARAQADGSLGTSGIRAPVHAGCKPTREARR